MGIFPDYTGMSAASYLDRTLVCRNTTFQQQQATETNSGTVFELCLFFLHRYKCGIDLSAETKLVEFYWG